MQRRLMIAMVGLALAAVVFVGAGVLALAQIGARADTEQRVTEGLDALSDLVTRTENVETIRNLERTRVAFDLDELTVVVVDGETVFQVRTVGPSRRGQAQPQGPFRDREFLTTLSPDEQARFTDGEVVFLGDGGRRRQVVGIQSLDLAPDAATARSDIRLGILASRRVEPVPSQARAWFVLSGLAVVVLAVAAAWLVARRITRPLTAIEAATAGIAAGDFGVRVEAAGDDELAQLGRSVNRMATDLQRSKALDQQFLMSVSHDLRTPLTAISGYAEALRDGALTDTVQAGEIIGNQADRLERLVGDLLDLARLDANRFQLNVRSVDAAVIVGRTAAGLTHRAEEHGLALRVDGDGPIPVTADPDRLAQCVDNLIDNALKFARNEVVVGVGHDGAEAWIVVTDDGPGIEAADLPHVFERLYTGANRPERAENPSGLGLAIVRELMAAMGGTVSAWSEPGSGAVMTLRLPLTPS